MSGSSTSSLNRSRQIPSSNLRNTKEQTPIKRTCSFLVSSNENKQVIVNSQNELQQQVYNPIQQSGSSNTIFKQKIQAIRQDDSNTRNNKKRNSNEQDINVLRNQIKSKRQIRSSTYSNSSSNNIKIQELSASVNKTEQSINSSVLKSALKFKTDDQNSNLSNSFIQQQPQSYKNKQSQPRHSINKFVLINHNQLSPQSIQVQSSVEQAFSFNLKIPTILNSGSDQINFLKRKASDPSKSGIISKPVILEPGSMSRNQRQNASENSLISKQISGSITSYLDNKSKSSLHEMKKNLPSSHQPPIREDKLNQTYDVAINEKGQSLTSRISKTPTKSRWSSASKTKGTATVPTTETKQSQSILSSVNRRNNSSYIKSNRKSQYEQYDLDNTFINIFNQSSFASPNRQSRVKSQKKIKSILYPLSQSPKGSQVMSTAATPVSPRRNKKISVLHFLQYGNVEQIKDEIEMKRHEHCKKIISDTLKDLEEDNFIQIAPLLIELLSRAVDINDLRLFEVLVEYMGDLAYEMGDLDIAAFFFDQSMIIYGCTNNHVKKAKSLLSLAKCSRQRQLYDESHKLLRKALEYSWLSNQNDTELEIYDEMGRNYYFEGHIQKAQYYHNRFVGRQYEHEESPTRVFSDENLKNYLQQKPFKFNDVNSLLLSYLKLPLLTLEQLPVSSPIIYNNFVNSQTPRAQVSVDLQSYYKKVKVPEIITKTLDSHEFYIIIQSPKCNTFILFNSINYIQ